MDICIKRLLNPALVSISAGLRIGRVRTVNFCETLGKILKNEKDTPIMKSMVSTSLLDKAVGKTKNSLVSSSKDKTRENISFGHLTGEKL